MSAAGPARLARFLWQEAIRRPIPHGLVHWRYIQPHPPGPLSRQRSVWLASLPALPRPAWLALEVWLWLRWQLWSGPRSVWRAARRLGPRVREEEGLGLARQAWRTWTLSLAYCVPPSEVYQYRLYRRLSRLRAGELVYDHTCAAFHAARNSGPGGARASLRLLADKQRQTAELAALGVPMVPILAVVGRATGARLEAHVAPGEARFCKPRHGSRGKGAFGAHWEGGDLVVETLDGLRLRDSEAAAHWVRLLDDDDMLVQPRLSVHQDVADLATDDDIVTVRYISERGLGREGGETDVDCYCATIELAAGRLGEERRPAYVILEVNPLSGAIEGFPPERLSREAAGAYDRVRARLGQRRVPGWDELRRGSHIAHASFPGIHAIAWDWAITSSGPLLLEGNGGWGVATPQMLKGGLLALPAPGGSG